MSASTPVMANAAEGRGEKVRAMFAAITPRYDLLNTVLSGGIDRLWRRRVIALAALEPGGSALDVCTGTGELAKLLATAVGRSGQARGLDFCAEMLAVAGAKFPQRDWPQLSWIQGDAQQLPCEDAAFDAATMAFGLRNVESPSRAFAEMHRVLRPGGRALILELTRPSGPLKLLYYPYLFGVLPFVGGALSRNFGAYRYLARTIAAFLPVDRLLDEMRAAGFRNVASERLCGGIATILRGEK